MTKQIKHHRFMRDKRYKKRGSSYDAGSIDKDKSKINTNIKSKWTMGRILKDEYYKGYVFKFYRTDVTGWVRTHIQDRNKKLVSSYDSRNKTDALRKGKDWIDKRDVIACFRCGDIVRREDVLYWYHGDQDDLVCEECAKKLEHTDTIYSGMNVYESMR